jgi:drug/metabolite transporter (DMT)-like permease
MTWFLIALIGPFLYALTNHIDKILLEKYFKEGGAGTLILFSSLLSAIALPFLFFADTSVFAVDTKSIIALAVVGVLNLAVLWLYFLALSDEEASITVVFYQLVPVFGLALGYFILGETVAKIHLLAMAIIILGTSIVSFEVDQENKFSLRRKTIFLMVSASFLWALESVIFKAVALEENVLRSLFWENLMLVIVGMIIFVLVKTYRNNFLSALKQNSKAVLSLNVANESLFMLGNAAFAFAYMLAPIALILLTQSFQPIFVFAIGIFLTIFFPKISAEKIQAMHLWQKFFAICITGIGTYILLSF